MQHVSHRCKQMSKNYICLQRRDYSLIEQIDCNYVTLVILINMNVSLYFIWIVVLIPRQKDEIHLARNIYHSVELYTQVKHTKKLSLRFLLSKCSNLQRFTVDERKSVRVSYVPTTEILLIAISFLSKKFQLDFFSSIYNFELFFFSLF